MNTLEKHTKKLGEHGLTTIAYFDQSQFMQEKAGMISKGLKMMIEGAELYCKGYPTENEYQVGEDGYSGEFMRDILVSLHYLLSAPGKFNGGTLSAAIHEIAENAKIKMEL